MSICEGQYVEAIKLRAQGTHSLLQTQGGRKIVIRFT